MPTREKLKNYILENYLFTDDQSALNDSDSFMEQGIIDSTGIMEVVFFLEEEFDIQVTVGSHIATHRHAYEHIKIELIAHETKIKSGEFQLRDHDAIVWVTPEEARAYKLAPADIPILEHILQSQN